MARRTTSSPGVGWCWNTAHVAGPRGARGACRARLRSRNLAPRSRRPRARFRSPMALPLKERYLPCSFLKPRSVRFEIELFEKEAPVSSANFLSYVDDGFFDGLIFHRVIPGLHDPGRRLRAGHEAEEGQGADQERGDQRPEEQARHAGDGAHQRHQQRHGAVLHQPGRQRVPRSRRRRPTTATRYSARSPRAWT